MMRRLPALALVLLLAGLGCLHLARSQTLLLLGAGKGAAGGASYQGSIDASGVTASGGWGIRCLRAAYCGGNLANICTVIATVDTCLDFSSDASTGNLIIVTIGGLTCGGAVVCTAKILYGQAVSDCNMTQNTVSQRPILTPSAQGSLPGLTFTIAANTNMSCPGTLTVAQPFGLSLVAKRTASNTTLQDVLGNSGGQIQFGFSNTAANIYVFTGGGIKNASAADNAIHSVQAVINGASSTLYVDGSTTATDVGTATGFSDSPVLPVLDGVFFEGLIFPSGPNAAAVTTNQCAYYGIGGC